MLDSIPWRSFAVRHRKPIVIAAVLAVAIVVVLLGRFERSVDFREFPAGPVRKAEFFAYMRPLVNAENASVLDDRQRLGSLAGNPDPGWFDRRWLERLAGEYGAEDSHSLDRAALIATLLRRVDVVPMSLTLAQAAAESGWGTSRFFLEGNNVFGEWCYEPGCGLTPERRTQGRTHEVRAFASPAHSVSSYIRNINTHPSYQGFRQLRARMRAEGRTLSGLELARELTRYSERGDAYVGEIREMIRFNELEIEDNPAPDGN